MSLRLSSISAQNLGFKSNDDNKTSKRTMIEGAVLGVVAGKAYDNYQAKKTTIAGNAATITSKKLGSPEVMKHFEANKSHFMTMGHQEVNTTIESLEKFEQLHTAQIVKVKALKTAKNKAEKLKINDAQLNAAKKDAFETVRHYLPAETKVVKRSAIGAVLGVAAAIIGSKIMNRNKDN